MNLNILRKKFSTVVLLLALLILVKQVRSLYIELRLKPTSDEVAAARAVVSKAIPLVKAFKKETGAYPCHISEVIGHQYSPLEKLGWYQATSNGYYFFVKNPGGIPVILWDREGVEAEWAPCTQAASCSPGEFAKHCCGREKYPKCEVYGDRIKDHKEARQQMNKSPPVISP